MEHGEEAKPNSERARCCCSEGGDGEWSVSVSQRMGDRGVGLKKAETGPWNLSERLFFF